MSARIFPERPLTDKEARDRHHAKHPEARQAAQDRYRERHREELNARARLARAMYPERHRAADARHRAKHPEAAARLRDERAQAGGLANFAARLGPCDICGDIVMRHLDHEHRSGMHRGWLCGPCNRGLGMFKDDPARLAAAMAYLGPRLLKAV